MLLLGPARLAKAQEEPIVTDRPDQTESASTAPFGTVQLEVGWTLSTDRTFDFLTREHVVLGALARIGLGTRLEARIGFAGWTTQMNEPPTGPTFDRSGLGDLDVGVKLKLADASARRPAVAVLGTLALPTGAEPFQRRRADPRVRLAFAHELSDRVGLGYNVGTEWNTECDPTIADACGERAFTDGFYTVAFGFSLTDALGAFIESFGTVPLNEGRVTRHAVDGGFTFLLRENLQFDVHGGVGANDEAGDWFVGAGVAVRLPK